MVESVSKIVFGPNSNSNNNLNKQQIPLLPSSLTQDNETSCKSHNQTISTYGPRRKTYAKVRYRPYSISKKYIIRRQTSLNQETKNQKNNSSYGPQRITYTKVRYNPY